MVALVLKSNFEGASPGVARLSGFSSRSMPRSAMSQMDATANTSVRAAMKYVFSNSRFNPEKSASRMALEYSTAPAMPKTRNGLNLERAMRAAA